jgi:hypothetical protein
MATRVRLGAILATDVAKEDVEGGWDVGETSEVVRREAVRVVECRARGFVKARRKVEENSLAVVRDEDESEKGRSSTLLWVSTEQLNVLVEAVLTNYARSRIVCLGIQPASNRLQLSLSRTILCLPKLRGLTFFLMPKWLFSRGSVYDSVQRHMSMQDD